eukprot:COSAG03_NODE_16716_length_394_cov_0.654237_2_plen_64_part_01
MPKQISRAFSKRPRLWSHDCGVCALAEARLDSSLAVRIRISVRVVLQWYDTEVDGEPRVRSVVM